MFVTEQQRILTPWHGSEGGRSFHRAPIAAGWYDAVDEGWWPSVSDVRAGCLRLPSGKSARPIAPNSVLSAVLIFVFNEAGEPHVALIERSHRSPNNPGELAFPGGILHPRESALTAALRETEEEVGVKSSDIEVLASLDEIATPSGFLVRPYIGLVTGRPDFLIDPTEVERVVTVSLAELALPSVHRQLPFPGTGVLLNHFDVGELNAWGMTGDLLAQLLTIAADGRRGDDRVA